MNVAPLQELTAEVRASAAHLFTVKAAVAVRPRGGRTWDASRTFLGSNPPFGARLYYYLKSAQFEGTSAPRVVISDSLGKKIMELAIPAQGGTRAGLHMLVWGLSSDLLGAELVPPGDYVATLQVAGKSYQQRIRVEAEE